MKPRGIHSALALLFLAMVPAQPRAASTTVLSASGVTQPWLGLGTDVRDLGLGGAVGVVSEGSSALQDNPSGLDGLVDPEITLDHNEWNTDLGIREETLGYGRRVGDGAMAGSFRYFSYGTFDNRDVNGAPLGSSTDGAYAGTLGYAQSFWNDAWRLGAALTASQEVLSGQSTTLYVGSLGATYLGPWGLRAGAALLNDKLSGESANSGPGASRLSLGWVSRSKALQFDADWLQPQLGDGTISLGGEWTLAGNYSLRAGWRFAQGEGSALDAGPSVGAGLRLGDLRLDYAFVPFGALGNSQQVGATLYLGGGLFGGNIVIEGAGNSAEAQSFYNEGMAAFKDGDWAGAKVALRHALKLNAGLPQAAQAKQTMAEADQRILAAKSRGNTPDIKNLFSKKLQEAKAEYLKGDLLAARQKVEEIFEIDANLKDALDLRQKIEQDLAEKIEGLKNAAADALQNGDLAEAVLKYRAVLKLDEEEKDTRDHLIKLAPRVAEEVRRLHRDGIDAYINNDMDRAITLWQQALDLDPSDPRNIKRDMDKAKKMKALRSN